MFTYEVFMTSWPDTDKNPNNEILPVVGIGTCERATLEEAILAVEAVTDRKVIKANHRDDDWIWELVIETDNGYTYDVNFEEIREAKRCIANG